jgi:hypothetical protein
MEFKTNLVFLNETSFIGLSPELSRLIRLWIDRCRLLSNNGRVGIRREQCSHCTSIFSRNFDAVTTDQFDLIFSQMGFCKMINIKSNRIQSNLCTTTTLGTQNLWPLLTVGRCSEVALCYKNRNRYPKIVESLDQWSLFGGGRELRFDCTGIFQC